MSRLVQVGYKAGIGLWERKETPSIKAEYTVTNESGEVFKTTSWIKACFYWSQAINEVLENGN